MARKRATIGAILLVVALMGFAPREARAELIVGNLAIEETFLGSGIWTWTYLLEVGPTQEVRPTSVFTIYDFEGYVLGSQMSYSADWTPLSTLTGITPTGLADIDDGVPFDNPLIPNLSWTYTGTTNIASTETLSNTVVGEFWAESIYGPPPGDPIFNDWFAGEAYGESSGLREFNSEANILVPENPVPEPGSMLLLSSGLFGAAAIMRRRRKAQAETQV